MSDCKSPLLETEYQSPCTKPDCIFKICSDLECKKIRFEKCNIPYKYSFFELPDLSSEDTTQGDVDKINQTSNKDSVAEFSGDEDTE